MGGQPSSNTAKEMLAFELTKMVHGEEEAKKALDAAKALFVGGGSSENMPSTAIAEEDLTDGKIGVLDLLVKTGLAPSKGKPPAGAAGRYLGG